MRVLEPPVWKKRKPNRVTTGNSFEFVFVAACQGKKEKPDRDALLGLNGWCRCKK
jgi:hypothetical protein